jgi:hypothetical protein
MSAMALTKGSKACFKWLVTKKAGDVVSRDGVLHATGWTESSLKTYLTKNKLAPFLAVRPNRELRVLMDGSDISEDYFDEVFTQTAPAKVSLTASDKLVGENGTYTLIEPLGQGAVGHVWSARTQRNQMVAAKVMLPREDLLADSRIVDVRRRFGREARNGMKLERRSV